MLPAAAFGGGPTLPLFVTFVIFVRRVFVAFVAKTVPLPLPAASRRDAPQVQ